MQLLNPGTLSTLSMLFPDAKYDVALVQDAWQNKTFCNTQLAKKKSLLPNSQSAESQQQLLPELQNESIC